MIGFYKICSTKKKRRNKNGKIQNTIRAGTMHLFFGFGNSPWEKKFLRSNYSKMKSNSL